jgi:hypothetical protein
LRNSVGVSTKVLPARERKRGKTAYPTKTRRKKGGERDEDETEVNVIL